MKSSFLAGKPRSADPGFKNGHLRRFPHPSSLRRTHQYASVLGISGALHLAIFEQPEKIIFPSNDQISILHDHLPIHFDRHIPHGAVQM